MNFRTPKHLLLSILLLFATNYFLLAQDFNYIQYTTDDGLPTNYVYGVTEDEEGNIWAYTENGLSKFDGYTFQNYTTKDGLPGNDVCFAERAPDGKVWLYTYQERPAYLYQDSIHIVHDKACVYFGLFEGMPFYSSREGVRTFVFRDSLEVFPWRELEPDFIKYYGAELELRTKIPDTPENRQNLKSHTRQYGFLEDSIFVLDNSIRKNPGFGEFDRLYAQIETDKATLIWKRKGGAWVTRTWPGILDQLYPTSQADKVIFRTGVFTYHLIHSSTKETIKLSLLDYGIQASLHSRVSIQDDFFWLISDAGALCFDYNGQLLTKIAIRGLSEYTLLNVYTDSKGNIWIGSENGGLFMIPYAYSRTSNITLPTTGEQYFECLLTTANGKKIAIAANGDIYLIESDSLIGIKGNSGLWNFRTAVEIPHGLTISNSSRLSLLSDKEGHISIQPLWSSDISFETNLHEEQQSSLFAQTLFGALTSLTYDDKKQVLYACSSGKSMFRFHLDFSSKVVRGKYFDLPMKLVYYHKEQDALYSSDGNKLYLLEGEKFKSILQNHTPLNHISTLHGTAGKLWIGTEDYGLFYYDINRDSLRHVFPDYFVKAIRSDGDRGVVVATNNGVMIVSANTQDTFEHYTTKDGLAINEVEDVLAVGDTLIYIATAQGLQQLNRQMEPPSKLEAAALRLTKIVVNDSLEFTEDPLSLAYKQNNIEFHFQLRSYASNGDITYVTQIEPLESAWQISKERSRKFLDLKPGTYTFHLKATDTYGQKIVRPPFVFTIHPAFWQRWWFKVLAMLVFMGGLFYLGWRRLRKEQQELKEERILNRRMATLELNALKAQMNPHFVFNALGAIQYFIQTHDMDSADNYLTKFARLMRRFLDSSREKMIALTEEIELLKNYTELEQMRFENQFDIRVEVDEALSKHDFMVPTMLIQPFVENAINHGLGTRKDGEGVLIIKFEQNGQDLTCLICDNGIGHEKSKLKTRKGHRSRGMEIVEEKIKTLRSSGLADIQILVQNYVPDDKEFPGTQVILNIKNLDNDEN